MDHERRWKFAAVAGLLLAAPLSSAQASGDHFKGDPTGIVLFKIPFTRLGVGVCGPSGMELELPRLEPSSPIMSLGRTLPVAARPATAAVATAGAAPATVAAAGAAPLRTSQPELVLLETARRTAEILQGQK